MRVIVRDEEWIVRLVRSAGFDGTRVEVARVSELVRDQDSAFFDHPQLDTSRDERLVADASTGSGWSRFGVAGPR